jgi:hypothetical protein
MKGSATSPPAFYEHQCFVSYTTREDEVRVIKPFIDQYQRALQDAWNAQLGPSDLNVYYDGWRIQPGFRTDAWLRQTLERAIRSSAFVVAFLSPGYHSSEWCQWELSVARDEHEHRGTPALDCSCLPILWKNENRRFRHPFVADRAPVDVRGAIAHGPEAWPDAVHDAVTSTIRVAREWYPSSGSVERKRPSWLNYIT